MSKNMKRKNSPVNMREKEVYFFLGATSETSLFQPLGSTEPFLLT